MNRIAQWGAWLLLVIATGCSGPAADAPATNFENWIKETDKFYSNYLVVEMDGCGECTRTAVKLIKDGFLTRDTLTAIVLVAKDPAALYPVKESRHLPNLLVYPRERLNQPILGSRNRQYRHSPRKGFSFTELDARAFLDVPAGMFSIMLPRGYEPSPSALGNQAMKGTVIPGHEALLVPSDSGQVKVSTDY
jgi:hypothetical protein